MSRAAQSFKQSELTKAIKALLRAGVKDWRLEIIGSRITVFAAGQPEAAAPEIETSADLRKLL